MSKVSALRTTPPPPRSPERENLAAAIQSLAEARSRLADTEAAHQRAYDAGIAASAAVREATLLRAASAAEEPRSLVASFLGRPAADTGKLDRLREEYDLLSDAAQYDLDERRLKRYADDPAVVAAVAKDAALRRACEILKGEIKVAEAALHWATRHHTEAFAAAVAADPAVARLWTEYTKARASFEALVPTMHHLARLHMLPPEAACWNLITYFDAKLPGESPWHARLATLATDADAALPE
jgi:hypothetical protein